MNFTVILGILLPFLGTALGAAAVFLTHKRIFITSESSLSGFAAGVMLAASVWSLIIPAVEMSAHLGFFSLFPVLLGLWLGLLFLIASEKLFSSSPTVDSSGRLLFFMAVVLHNIPEGMAVGVAFACALGSNLQAGLAGALMLSLGMTLQNIPEGAIISAPLAKDGLGTRKAFWLGSLSGAVEPVAAFVTLFFSSAVTFLLPYLLGFAAGAMLYVTVKELVPKSSENMGALWFFAGFSLMMALDIILG